MSCHTASPSRHRKTRRQGTAGLAGRERTSPKGSPGEARIEAAGPPWRNSRQAGFTLAEVIVSLAVSMMLILSVLTIFEANARIARVQTDVADMQQNQRVAQHEMMRNTRMAGRGGLPMGAIPGGLAIAVRNNVGIDAHISTADDSTPEVLDGTDVLTVRGVFSTPVFPLTDDTMVLNGPAAAPTDGTFQVPDHLIGLSQTPIPMDISPLIEAVNEGRPEALIIVNPLSDQVYAVVELDPSASDVSDPTNITVGFRIQGGTHTDAYNAMSPGGYPSVASNNDAVGFVGIVEEYRYYVQEVRAGGDLFPFLARARVYPGTQTPHDDNPVNWSVEIAENIFDLQVAYGIDTDGDGVVADGNILPGLTPDVDEWLFNHPDDDESDLAWTSGTPFYIRLTNLVRTDRPDQKYLAPVLLFIEDHDYGASFLNNEDERAHRRRTLVTTVDLRNL